MPQVAYCLLPMLAMVYAEPQSVLLLVTPASARTMAGRVTGQHARPPCPFATIGAKPQEVAS
eukprot:4830604-Amphidinium_carterae.1